jgi:hypothetical protein
VTDFRFLDSLFAMQVDLKPASYSLNSILLQPTHPALMAAYLKQLRPSSQMMYLSKLSWTT